MNKPKNEEKVVYIFSRTMFSNYKDSNSNKCVHRCNTNTMNIVMEIMIVFFVKFKSHLQFITFNLILTP